MYDAQGIYYVCVANYRVMIMNINFIFNGTKVSDEDKKTLSSRIESRIQVAVEGVLEPYEYNEIEGEGAWTVTIPGFPSGGYASRKQAMLAVSLLKVKPSMTYAELYQLSQFILNGLG